MRKTILFLASFIVAVSMSAQELSTIVLPKPDKKGGAKVMVALDNRHSDREFLSSDLPYETLSDLLWAANGINRPDGKRTAPSAMNRQEIDIYVVNANGAYFYNPQAHQLELLHKGDFRDAVAGPQKFAAVAPVSIVLVGNLERFGRDDEQSRLMVAADAGIVCENINIYCASAGLSTVPRATMDKKKLAEVLMLDGRQMLLLNNPVGYPVKK